MPPRQRSLPSKKPQNKRPAAHQTVRRFCVLKKTVRRGGTLARPAFCTAKCIRRQAKNRCFPSGKPQICDLRRAGRCPAPTGFARNGVLRQSEGGVAKCIATPPNQFNRPEGTPQLPHQRQFHTAAGCISHGVSHISHADRRISLGLLQNATGPFLCSLNPRKRPCRHAWTCSSRSWR